MADKLQCQRAVIVIGSTRATPLFTIQRLDREREITAVTTGNRLRQMSTDDSASTYAATIVTGRRK